MIAPIKAIYIKSNPGTHGTGLIENIRYINIRGAGSLMMPIWIGIEYLKCFFSLNWIGNVIYTKRSSTTTTTKHHWNRMFFSLSCHSTMSYESSCHHSRQYNFIVYFTSVLNGYFICLFTVYLKDILLTDGLTMPGVLVWYWYVVYV